MDKPKILIIEDNPIHRRVLEKTLETVYYLDCAADSEQAFAKLAVNRYDLVVVDLRLPERYGELATDVEGFRILKVLEKEYKNKLVVLGVSGHMTDYLERQINEFDIVNRIFEKPFSRYEIRTYIDEQLGVLANGS